MAAALTDDARRRSNGRALRSAGVVEDQLVEIKFDGNSTGFSRVCQMDGASHGHPPHTPLQEDNRACQLG